MRKEDLRCPHCLRVFIWADCINSPGALPDEGSVGFDAPPCGRWWKIENGSVVKYCLTVSERKKLYEKYQ